MMKPFFKNIALFGLVALILSVAISFLDWMMIIDKVPGVEVYRVMRGVNRQQGYRGLILGDSVCGQFFKRRFQGSDTFYYYGSTTAAITLAGQFFLLHDWLQKNPQTQEVVLMFRPQSLCGGGNISDIYGYTYFVLPFHNSRYRKHYSAFLSRTVQEKYPSWSVHPLVVWMNKHVVFFRMLVLPHIRPIICEFPEDEHEISGITAEYLNQIDMLCKDKGVTLRLIASPLPDTDKSRQYVDGLKRANETAPSTLFNRYLDSIIYFEANLFGDGVHFDRSFSEKNRTKIIRMLGITATE